MCSTVSIFFIYQLAIFFYEVTAYREGSYMGFIACTRDAWSTIGSRCMLPSAAMATCMFYPAVVLRVRTPQCPHMDHAIQDVVCIWF